jgi:hypothetical protein
MHYNFVIIEFNKRTVNNIRFFLFQQRDSDLFLCNKAVYIYGGT